MTATYLVHSTPARHPLPAFRPSRSLTCFLRLPDRSRIGGRTSPMQAPPRAEDEERDLVDRLLRDDPAAWRELDSKYSRIVLSCIHRVLARFGRVTGSHDVEEVYARFCLQLLANDKKKLRAFDPDRGNKLSSWLGLLATHATYDYLRVLRRDSTLEPLPDSERLGSCDTSPYEATLLRERARIAAQMMATLSKRDREFVELYFGEGLEPEQVASEMGINVKTVYSKKHKITARLEGLLDGKRAA